MEKLERRRQWSVLSPDCTSGHYSLSRHSIPVHANNILYFKHNKRSLFLRSETEIRVVFYKFFSHSFGVAAYVQKYFDDVIISCRIVRLLNLLTLISISDKFFKEFLNDV